MDTISPSLHPEIWGGIECTLNRIADNYRDQLTCAGYYSRPDDIDKIASLGIKKLRYPVLWEAHQKHESDLIDWTITRRQLAKIRAQNMVPIVGLMHHGSGPDFANLPEVDFANKLAVYAGQVAEVFPWMEYYIPVNEPLTTARFTGLYGHWHPHHKNDKSFSRIFLNQLKGIVLSMQAIRRVNPLARLVQTEDLAKIHSTPFLAYQSEFENKRRWLTYDILCGQMNKDHPLRSWFLSNDILEKDLAFFVQNPYCKL